MRFTSFLRSQILVLFLATSSTFACIVYGLRLVQFGIGRLLESAVSGSSDTFRGLPNPGGSTTFVLILVPFVAIVCWWSMISDWKDAKRKGEEEKGNLSSRDVNSSNSK